MARLWAIACYFNPVGYRRRLENYHTFKRNLMVPLVTVELAYRDGFELPDDAADTLIRLRGRDVLWQKERLLNLALRALPAECDAVAWLDCDIVFEDGDWSERALRALDRYPMLQPFERLYELSESACNEAPLDAFKVAPAYSVAHLLARGEVTPGLLRGVMRARQTGTSGLAWVARRELLDRDGFYDACVIGSGNRAMISAALGRPDDAIHYLRMKPRWAEHYLTWAEGHAARVRGNIGCVEGSLIHLWHGHLEHRRYDDRHSGFAIFDYDPSRDIALDDEGCWRWNSDKPEMHEFVTRYFRERREDGVDGARRDMESSRSDA